jgi:inhibitor of cysteine peptidase
MSANSEGPGSATLTTTYGQPWPGGTADAWTFSAVVSVR